MRGGRLWIAAIAVVAGVGVQARGQEQRAPLTLRVDASRQVGEIRPLQGVVGGPLCQRGAVDLTRYYKELRVPLVRLHDAPWTYDNVLDINYIFPDWSASPDDPKSYHFRGSDYYLRTVVALHTNIIYRIGYSAEYKTPVRHNGPPASFAKFAAIAKHILMHYNQGWDHGHRWGIRYWEIWNEPDIQNFWTGTPKQYDQLYTQTAKVLKATDPSIRVGGPALAAHYDFLEQFLRYGQSHHAPLDFVSWHLYARDPNAVVENAKRVHDLMERFGFGKAESFLDEWNFGWTDWNDLFTNAEATRAYFHSTQSGQGAAFDAAVLSKLQDAPISDTTFYTGTTEMWGLFTSAGAPQTPYYALLAFRKLLDTPSRIAVEGLRANDAALSALAGVSRSRRVIRVLLSNTSSDARNVTLEFDHVPWQGAGFYSRQEVGNPPRLRAVTRDAKLAGPVRFRMGAHTVQLITVTAVARH